MIYTFSIMLMYFMLVTLFIRTHTVVFECVSLFVRAHSEAPVHFYALSVLYRSCVYYNCIILVCAES